MLDIIGTILATRHGGRSPMGNPKFTVALQTEYGVEILDAAPNSGLAYAIEAAPDRTTPHTFARNARGQITSARAV